MTHHHNPNLAANVTYTGQKILMPILRTVLPNLMAQQILGVQPMTTDFGSLFTIKYRPPTESKYKFSRANWYVAEFDVAHYNEVDEWCEQQFGPHPKCPDAWSRWMHKYEDKIHFRDEKDYIWFILRWGGQ